MGELLRRLFAGLEDVPILPIREGPAVFDPRRPTAAVLISTYGGLGIHTVLQIFKEFPGHFHNLIFVTVGVLDSGGFKGDTSIDELTARSQEMLARYVELAGRLNLPASTRFALGTDPVDAAARLCEEIAREVPNTVFFAGKIVFERETWLHRALHNETAWAIQRRLQWAGRPMVVVPARVR